MQCPLECILAIRHSAFNITLVVAGFGGGLAQSMGPQRLLHDEQCNRKLCDMTNDVVAKGNLHKLLNQLVMEQALLTNSCRLSKALEMLVGRFRRQAEQRAMQSKGKGWTVFNQAGFEI